MNKVYVTEDEHFPAQSIDAYRSIPMGTIKSIEEALYSMEKAVTDIYAKSGHTMPVTSTYGVYAVPTEDMNDTKVQSFDNKSEIHRVVQTNYPEGITKINVSSSE
ncbi:MAG: hypothetical protein IS632_06260 [Thaumarchaeota archaeon]|nr:hypothetical protein [Nitrososphaerota archaeon]